MPLRKLSKNAFVLGLNALLRLHPASEGSQLCQFWARLGCRLHGQEK